MIHQELTLIPEMTVDENIWLGREKLYENHGYLNLKKRMQATRSLLGKYGIDLNPEVNVEDLSVAQMQQAELARALSYDADVIIMDEPTSSFTTKEITQLYKIIKILTKRRKGIIFITHKLDEIFVACDTAVVLRDGQYIGKKLTKDETRDELMGICDRAIVMSCGKVTGEVDRSEFDEKRLMGWALRLFWEQEIWICPLGIGQVFSA